MPIPNYVKQRAYRLDPECWVSYSGKPREFKQYMEARRARSLELAAKAPRRKMERPLLDRHTPLRTSFLSSKMTPMKISMMLHFYAIVGPFGTEDARRSDAYVQFVRELLHAGMIERPTRSDRIQHPGWAYRATEKGRVYVEALTHVPLPVEAPPQPAPTRWVMPDSLPKF